MTTPEPTAEALAAADDFIANFDWHGPISRSKIAARFDAFRPASQPSDVVKLWKISWPDYVMPYWGDRYDSAVVTAETEAEARAVHPSQYAGWQSITWAATPDLVVAEEIGTTGLPAGKVVCASFNAA
jgi:hypothetical protein